MEQKIRLGMVGGGNEAFIGNVHRIAARLDNKFELVAGALSSTKTKSIDSGKILGLPKDRTYENFTKMAVSEANLDDGIQAVSIVTPNNVHYPAALEFLKRGIHVICDKPLTSTLSDAKKLVKLVEKSKALFILTHNYTGYPLVRQAREMVKEGLIGKVRVVQVEYAQDWLTNKQDFKQAEWRTDPNRSGVGGCIADIGTHAYNLTTFITNLQLHSLAADLTAFVPDRKVDDNANVMLRFKNGAKGMLWTSQVAPGNENSLKIRIYGESGGIDWAQENPNELWYSPYGHPKKLITRNGIGTSTPATRLSRIPPGHPEGYLEAFANIYSEASHAIQAHLSGKSLDNSVVFPTIYDGLNGMKFIDACIRSSSKNSSWIML